LTLDSENLLYDRKGPTSDFRLVERVAQSLPSKPKVYVVNVFTINQATRNEEKIKVLTEEYSIPKVAENIDLSL
jgi:hypothetical protein